MRARLISLLRVLTHPVIALGGSLIIAGVIVGLAWHMNGVTLSGHYVAAAIAPITATGEASSDLSFQVAGQVVLIPVSIGKKVTAGATLIALDRASLFATRAGAVANLEASQAKLASLTAGTRPEQLAINQTAVTQAANSLTSALQTAYTNADDAIHTKADQVFTNPRNSNVQLAISVPDATLTARLQMERAALEPMFLSWKTSLDSSTGAEAKVASSEANLNRVASFLNELVTALSETQQAGSVSSATLTGYQTSVNTGRLNVASSLSALIAADTAYKSATGALTLAQAGATQNDTNVQKAAVDAAQAVLSGIDVSLRNSVLIAPMAGTITVLNAHLGQTVTPGQILVSIESSGGSKQDALVVPSSSVIEDGSQAFVYAKGTGTVPVKTPVTVGLTSADGMTEIVSGLSSGQEVLSFGAGTK